MTGQVPDHPPQSGWRAVRRAVLELLLITVGVLAALAADRWAQSRDLAGERRAFEDRLIEEIRADSLRAVLVDSELPGTMAARDTLLASVMAGHSMSEDFAELIFRSMRGWALDQSVAWNELNSSGLLNLFGTDQRRALSEYYGRRAFVQRRLTEGEALARTPYVSAIYQLGMMRAAERDQRVTEFLAWPGMDRLLRGLDGYHRFIEILTPVLQQESGKVLRGFVTDDRR